MKGVVRDGGLLRLFPYSLYDSLPISRETGHVLEKKRKHD